MTEGWSSCIQHIMSNPPLHHSQDTVSNPTVLDAELPGPPQPPSSSSDLLSALKAALLSNFSEAIEPFKQELLYIVEEKCRCYEEEFRAEMAAFEAKEAALSAQKAALKAKNAALTAKEAALNAQKAALNAQKAVFKADTAAFALKKATLESRLAATQSQGVPPEPRFTDSKKQGVEPKDEPEPLQAGKAQNAEGEETGKNTR